MRRTRKLRNRDLKQLSEKVWDYVTEEECNIMWKDVYDFRTTKILKRAEKRLNRKVKDDDFFNE